MYPKCNFLEDLIIPLKPGLNFRSGLTLNCVHTDHRVLDLLNSISQFVIIQFTRYCLFKILKLPPPHPGKQSYIMLTRRQQPSPVIKSSTSFIQQQLQFPTIFFTKSSPKSPYIHPAILFLFLSFRGLSNCSQREDIIGLVY